MQYTFQAGAQIDGWVSILRGTVLPTTNGTDAGEEHEISKAADISEPVSELERLIADLSASGPRVGRSQPEVRVHGRSSLWHGRLTRPVEADTVPFRGRVPGMARRRCRLSESMAAAGPESAPDPFSGEATANWQERTNPAAEARACGRPQPSHSLRNRRRLCPPQASTGGIAPRRVGPHPGRRRTWRLPRSCAASAWL